MSPNRPTSSEHASFDELPPPSTASVHPPGQPPLARAVMSSSSAAPTAEEIKALIQQALDVHGHDTCSSSSSPPDTTTETASVPRVPAATPITFEAVNRLKDEATYPRWHRALKALVPTPIFSYLQTGNFPAECVLFNSLHPSIQDVYQEDDTPSQVYITLKERYSPRDAQAYAKLIQRFWSMPQIPLSSKDDFDKHLNHDLDLAREIRQGNLDIEQVLVAARLFSTNFNDGLDPWRETFLQLHQGKDRLPSLEETMKSMRVAAHNIIDKHPSAYVSNSDKSGTPPGPCPACKTGPLHWLRECTDEDAKKRFFSRPRPNRSKQNANAKPPAQARLAVASDDPGEISETAPSVSFAATSFPSVTSDSPSLLLDSAASHHMVNDSTAFVELHNTPRVQIGGLVASTGNRIRLSNVFFVPGCPANLISVFALINDGITASFTEDGRVSLDRGGKRVCTGLAKSDRLFHLDAHLCTHTALIAARTPKVSLLTLHRRLGHCSLPTLRKLAKSDQVKGIEWTYSDDDCNNFKCDACMASKAHKLPFPMSESHAALPLGLVHSDLLMFPEPSVSGRCYLITFIDDFSRKAWAFPLLRKSDALAAFQRWKAEVENASGATIKTLRSDNGGEYTAFNKFCAEQGIRRDKSMPYTPEQNRRAERLNRSIVEGVLALLHDSGLPAHLWEEATQYYLDCKNLTPHAGIDGGVPDAIWHGIPQDLSRLRTFGCRAWAAVPQHERTKLEPKGIPLIFSQCHVRGDRAPCRRATSLRARTALTCPYDRAAPRPGASFGTSRSCHTSNFSVAHAEHRFGVTTIVLAYAAHNASPKAPLDMLPSRDADPAHWHQAMRSPHAAEWQTEAINEFTSLLNQYKVYVILDQAALPNGAKLLRSHFVFRTKRDQFGNVKLRKARLVADGSTQRPGLDFQERYSPVVCFTSIRALVAIAVLRGYKIKQADVNKAYLHGKLDQPLYMRPPQGINLPGKILKLERSIYGLKQAGRIWNDEIDSTLRSVGYKPTVSDLCVYTKRHGNNRHYIALYVDDLLLIGPSDDEIERVLSTLEDMYGIKRLGDAEYVLGIQLKRSDDGSITLSQERYLQDVLERFDLALAKPASTPMQKNLLLELDQSTPSDQEQTRYLQAIGSLMYAALGTRPDLAYAVSYLARFAKEPGPTHWTAIKHVLRYI
ncbi:BQ5605_C006g04249 [Microbotryum silenes-dioicae]|uniref:BQ5605_C006g04249 protein n=1 Tax=Microbotryum silenes-dioicae TaxID=796604 RepID=A0A2X0M6F5_9BASI|nr:BQ5605_C006g04249 [Microbotryum silenes-dioicae]